MEVLLVDLEVARKLFYTFRQQRDLNLRRTGVCIVHAESLDDLLFLVCTMVFSSKMLGLATVSADFGFFLR